MDIGQFIGRYDMLLGYLLSLGILVYMLAHKSAVNEQFLSGPKSILFFYYKFALLSWGIFAVRDVVLGGDAWQFSAIVCIAACWWALQRDFVWLYLLLHFAHSFCSVLRKCNQDLSLCQQNNFISFPMMSAFYAVSAWRGRTLPLVMFALVLARLALLYRTFGVAAFVESTVRPDAQVMGAWAVLCALMFTMMFFLARLGADLFDNTREVLARYVSESVVDELFDDPKRTLRIGGSRRRVTILLSDLRGFSNLLATLEPEEAIELMNAYLADMLEVVHEHGGVVDEIIGDALLVIFGLQASDGGSQEASRSAVRCAAAMQAGMAGHPRLAQGIGLHCGDVIVGNIGSKRRAKFGVLGAAMNMAARIESFSLAGQIVVSDDLVAQVGSGFRWTLRGTRRVHPKGADSNGIEISLVDSVQGVNVDPENSAQSAGAPLQPRALRSPLAVTVDVLGGPAKSVVYSFPCKLSHIDATCQRLTAQVDRSHAQHVRADADVRFRVADGHEVIGRLLNNLNESDGKGAADLHIAVTFVGSNASHYLLKQALL